MIAQIEGTVTDEQVVLTAGGLGYEILSAETLAVGSQVRLWVRQILSETSDTLFGFPTLEQRQLFDALVKVNGVAGKTALALLRELGPDALVRAVAGEDAKALSKAKGVGPKLAAKIVAMVELPDGLIASAAETAGPTPGADLIAALTALGHDSARASELAAHVARETAGVELELDEQLRVALARR